MFFYVFNYIIKKKIISEQEIEQAITQELRHSGFLGRRFDASKYRGEFTDKWAKVWNKNIDQLLSDKKVLLCLEQIFELEVNLEHPKMFFAQQIARLNDDQPFVRGDDLCSMCSELLDADDKLQLGTDISVLEVCLLIAIQHHSEIYDRDPFNFEMILTRYRKFENSTQTRMESVERPIALKSFEHLHVSSDQYLCVGFYWNKTNVYIYILFIDAWNIRTDQHGRSQSATRVPNAQTAAN